MDVHSYFFSMSWFTLQNETFVFLSLVSTTNIAAGLP
jgi:hypothetical protein